MANDIVLPRQITHQPAHILASLPQWLRAGEQRTELADQQVESLHDPPGLYMAAAPTS